MHLSGFANRHGRQGLFLIGEFRFGVVAAFDVRPQIAGEVDRLAGDLEHAAAAFDLDRDAAGRAVGHLAGDRALPNQFEQLELVGAELAAQRLGELERMTGGANRFVRFLSVLDLGAVLAGFGRAGTRRRTALSPAAGRPRWRPLPGWSNRYACR